jgi:MFS transporter, ACS family, DAL5 transporter family protein
MGVLEATVNCGFVLITAKWYRKREHSSRVGVWAASNGFSTMVGAVVAYGCSRGSAEAHLSFHGWRILALVCGGLTVVFGGCMYAFMAESPIEAKFFSEDDKTLAVERLRDNHGGVGSKVFKWEQFREAFTDVRTWIYVLFILAAQIPAGGTTLFASLLYKSLGFDSNTSLLMSMPTGFIQICSNLGFGYLADRTGQRSLVAAGSQIINIFFASLLVGLSHVGPLHLRFGQLIAYFFIIGNGSTPYFIVISMISSNTLGYTKKTTVNGIVFTALAVAFLAGPQIFRDGPYYFKAKSAVIGLWVLALVLLFVLYLLNTRENAKRDKEEAEGRVPRPRGVEFLDLTDKENHNFRYVV